MGVPVAPESRVLWSNAECTRRTPGKGGIPEPVVRNPSGFRTGSRRLHTTRTKQPRFPHCPRHTCLC